jgi:hypothetical protein
MIARSLANRFHSAFFMLGLFTLVGYLAGCGGQASAPSLTSLQLTAANGQIPVGLTEQLKATGLYSDGSSQDLTASVAWASSPPNLASVSAGGLVSAAAAGSVTVSAKANQIAAAISLTVTPAVLKSLAISAGSPQIPLGSTEPLTATGTYSDGSQHDVTSTATWASLQPAIASVSGGGVVTAAAVGSASVTATMGAVNAQTQLTVTGAALQSLAIVADNSDIPLGDSEQLAAIGAYTDGSTLDLTTAAIWTSLQPAIASVGSSGLVSAEAVGPASVTAAMGTISAQTQLTVTAAALVSIAVKSSSSAIPLGETQQLSAIGTYTDGSTQNITTTVAWTSSPPNVVSIGAAGLATALAAGSTSAEAALNGVTGDKALTVQPTVLTSYFTTGAGIPDEAVRVSNPGFTGSTLCAMFYIFDQDQQMTECCGCTISPDGLRTLSVQTSLTANPLTGVQSTAGSITLVPAEYNGAPCNAASSTPNGLEIAWATHIYGSGQPQPTVSETPFSQLTLGSKLSTALQTQCAFVQELGSGKGICQCGAGE